jgi:hypothetical protein
MWGKAWRSIRSQVAIVNDVLIFAATALAQAVLDAFSANRRRSRRHRQRNIRPSHLAKARRLLAARQVASARRDMSLDALGCFADRWIVIVREFVHLPKHVGRQLLLFLFRHDRQRNKCTELQPVVLRIEKLFGNLDRLRALLGQIDARIPARENIIALQTQRKLFNARSV